MIDLSTISSLELIQNLQSVKSKENLYGFLNQTLTPMGARILRSNILQPSTDGGKLEMRHEAVTELSAKAYMFFAVRTGIKPLIAKILLTITSIEIFCRY